MLEKWYTKQSKASELPWGESWKGLAPPRESLRLVVTVPCPYGGEGPVRAKPSKLPLLQRRTGVDILIIQSSWVSPVSLRYVNTNWHQKHTHVPHMCMCVCLCGYRPWWAILFGRMEVLLHALVVLDLGGDWDRQWLTMVSITTNIVTSQELTGSANNSEKNRECRGKQLDKKWEG